jgi:hypothetical protein
MLTSISTQQTTESPMDVEWLSKTPLLLGHANDAAARDSALQLKGMGGAARKILAECVAKQGVERRSISKSVQSLWDAGFVFVHGSNDFIDPIFTINPSFMGEEALEALEVMEEKTHN